MTTQTIPSMKKIFRAGAARMDISPAQFCDLTGFLLRDNPATGIHDPIYARALALDDGNRQALLIVCDTLGFEPGFMDAQRQAIEQATGVPAAHIMCACTHTHAAPAAMTLVHCGEIDPNWLALLRERMLAAAIAAMQNLASAQISSGKAPTPPINANRRDPSDVVDRDLDIVRIDGANGPMAALLVYGCHPVAAGHTNRQVSADYFGILTTALEQQTGAIVLATSGACGDVNPAIDGNPFADRGANFELTLHVGNTLVEVALAAWNTLEPVSNPRLGINATRLALPLEVLPSTDQLAAQSERWRAGAAILTNPEWAEREAAAMLEWARQVEARRSAGTLRDTVDAEIQVLVLGDIVFIGVPGELFAALGLAIKAGIPVRHPIILGYTNSNIGYISTASAYERGGYEVASAYKFYNYPAALAAHAGQLVVETAISVAGAMRENRTD